VSRPFTRTNRISPKFEGKVPEPMSVSQSMESRVKALGFAVALALCAALAASPGRSQEDAANAGSDRNASRTGGVGIGDGGDIIGGRGAEPVRLEGGSAGLQRRANRKSLIANAPNMPAAPSANIGAMLPFKRSGADGGSARNAIGVVVPGGGQGFGHAVPGSMTSAGIGARGPGSGGVDVGAATGNVADARRSAIPPNAVTSPVAHTSGINGTTMGHVASGPGYIGGPAKDRSGINGTAMRPRH
jgi:hypothetical protein